MPPPPAPFAVLFAVFTLACLLSRRARCPKRNFPPGPKRYPIIGNLLDMPNKREWLTYSKWKAIYGDIVGLRVLGQSIIILNSAELIEALLDKRNAIYSDRPCMAVITKWCGGDWFMTALPYGEEFHTQRKMINRFLSPSGVRSYHELIRDQVMKLVRRTAKDPAGFQGHNLQMVTAITMELTYGHEVREHNDPYVPLLERITLGFQKLSSAGAHPADLFPSLTRLPPAIFGREFAKEVDYIGTLSRQILNLPYENVKRQWLQGLDKPCMTSALMNAYASKDGQIRNERSIKATTGITYLAGADTTISAIDTFVLAMMLHPEAQKTAQRKIDELLQGKRLPELSDRESLPYIEAVIMEVLRWNPVSPVALPHRAMVDDEYEGMFIPAGTVLIPNTWQCLHDENAYPDPMSFNPERFMEKDEINRSVLDPRRFVFGYGRRICPGRHLAEATLFTTIAVLLASFDISLPIDANKRPIMPDMEYESSVAVSRPKPFRANFTPRSVSFPVETADS